MVISDIASPKTDEWFSNTKGLLSSLISLYPVYAVDGNYEEDLDNHINGYRHQRSSKGSYDLFWSELKKIEVHNLNNCSVYMKEPNIAITGLKAGKGIYRKKFHAPLILSRMTELVDTSKRDHFNVLLEHTPKYFPIYCKWEQI